MKMLIIEDDEDKLKTLAEFIDAEFPGYVVETAKSYNSGLRAIIKGNNLYDFILLDMSMPNYDVSPSEPSGGSPESFAGSELLAQMKLRNIQIPTVVVTMFDAFGDNSSKVSLDQLVEKLAIQFQPTFRGSVYYNPAEDGWRSSLKIIISSIMDDI
ncbi:DNA-binding transcriptional response regulator [Pseudomonas ogarae]|uniref:Response regulator n=1 Tax=Pseudomonas ogarae (strain DSM 112162 / CECT 30235 / F113) TaxID=1114970 RepID=A0ABM6QXZ2_PSEO1|nr:response regulator [Pseudomonas ogarae]AUO46144.1 response regulator [Pseudomonas ogarae]